MQLQTFGGVLEQDALVRIREMADAEGERRFRGVAAEVSMPIGDYAGRACASATDVASIFGVSRQAVQSLLRSSAKDIPNASETVEDSSSKFNLRLKTTLVFWPGFLACALRGRSEVARRIALDLVRVEERERVATAAGQVLGEEAAAELSRLRHVVAEELPRLRQVALDLPRLNQAAFAPEPEVSHA